MLPAVAASARWLLGTLPGCSGEAAVFSMVLDQDNNYDPVLHIEIFLLYIFCCTRFQALWDLKMYLNALGA